MKKKISLFFISSLIALAPFSSAHANFVRDINFLEDEIRDIFVLLGYTRNKFDQELKERNELLAEEVVLKQKLEELIAKQREINKTLDSLEENFLNSK